MFMRCKHLCLLTLLCVGSNLLLGLVPLPSCNPFLISACGLTTLIDDPSATQLNPIAGEGGVSTSTSFSYSMTSLNQVEIASIVNYQGNSMYAAWQSLDNEDYSRQDVRFGIRYSQSAFRVGVGYKILYDEIPGYGSDKDDRFNAGFRFMVKNTTIDLGSEHAMPVNQDNPFTAGDFSLNLGQQLEDNLKLALGLNLAEEKLSNIKLGCRFDIAPNLKAVASWESEPGRFGLGTIFNLKWLNLAYALQTHPELAWTHSVGISAMFP